MGIGKTLQQLLATRNSNVNEVATATGVSPSTLYSIIKRDSMSANIEDLYKVAHYLGVSLDFFYETKNLGSLAFAPCISPEEQELLRKYRLLDQHSKETVLLLVNHEAERSISKNVLSASAEFEYPKKIPFRISTQPASAGTGVYLGPDGFTGHMVNAEAVKGADFGVPVSGDSMEPLYKDGDIILVSMSSPVRMGDIALVTMDGCGYVKKLGKGVLISVNHHYAPIPVTEDIRINGKVIGVLPAQIE